MIIIIIIVIKIIIMQLSSSQRYFHFKTFKSTLWKRLSVAAPPRNSLRLMFPTPFSWAYSLITDQLKYDAFISFRGGEPGNGAGEDERFVYNTIMRVLEQEMGYRLCVHFRDFIPGACEYTSL